jgi:hypothetical protein
MGNSLLYRLPFFSYGPKPYRNKLRESHITNDRSTISEYVGLPSVVATGPGVVNSFLVPMYLHRGSILVSGLCTQGNL